MRRGKYRKLELKELNIKHRQSEVDNLGLSFFIA